MYEILSMCKGGGYEYCRTDPKHPKRNSKGLYPLHRVLMENKLKRSLLAKEQVHHKDKDKFNNNLDNLKVLTVEEHAKLHSPTLQLKKCSCSVCEKDFEVKQHLYHLRKKRNKSGKLFCSLSCSTKATYNSYRPDAGVQSLR